MNQYRIILEITRTNKNGKKLSRKYMKYHIVRAYKQWNNLNLGTPRIVGKKTLAWSPKKGYVLSAKLNRINTAGLTDEEVFDIPESLALAFCDRLDLKKIHVCCENESAITAISRDVEFNDAHLWIYCDEDGNRLHSEYVDAGPFGYKGWEGFNW